MKRAAIYLRVSTQDQTTANQEHELRQAAERAGWQVARVYKDHGISGAKGRNGRPAFDTLCRDALGQKIEAVRGSVPVCVASSGDVCRDRNIADLPIFVRGCCELHSQKQAQLKVGTFEPEPSVYQN